MSLKIANKGNKIGENGEPYNIIELISVRDGKEISVRYESDGIKKLIYIMYSLIEMYNDPSVTVAIDELDSGVFEYLLGELLSVLEESAKGQLIFTSHNLRALEVLNKKMLCFLQQMLITDISDSKTLRGLIICGMSIIRIFCWEDRMSVYMSRQVKMRSEEHLEVQVVI